MKRPERSIPTEDRLRKRVAEEFQQAHFGTHCVNCVPGDCPIYVLVKDGKVVREEAAGVREQVEPGVPDMNPMICQAGLAWSLQLEAPERLKFPLRRAGERGEGRWERISWDEALTEVADAMIDAIEEVGPEAIVQEISPQIGATGAATRLMAVLGGIALDVNATINDFHTGYMQTFGKSSFAHSGDDTFHTDVLVIWHGNPAFTNIPGFHFMTEARYRGGEVFLISTDVSPTHSHVDYHIPVRHGTDAALALAACQVVISEGLMKWDFVAAQTDLSFLVRTDTGQYLRQSHLEQGGRDDRFFQGHPDKGVVPADPGSLKLDFVPMAEGRLEVDTLDAGRVLVEPLFARLKRRLDAHYTPEQASKICEAHPDSIRLLARKVAARTTRISTSVGICKYYHGDLMSRSMVLLMALTGNWGRKGAGVGSWCSFMFDGTSMAMAKPEPGVEAAKAMLASVQMFRDGLMAQDPTLSPELADREIMRTMGKGMMTPPAFYWYAQAGFHDRWNNPQWNDPTMPRSFDEYYQAAVKSPSWSEAAELAATKPARVLIEIGGNTLRRTRGGKGALLRSFWPKLKKVVCIDFRMSQTALYADIVLPAAQHYEKATMGMPTPWPFILSMSHPTVKPYGESKEEWVILGDLMKKMGERAKARGLDGFPHRLRGTQRYEDLWNVFTQNGVFVDGEAVVREMLADSVVSGNLPPDTTIETFRKKGFTKYNNWAFMALMSANASPFPRNETHSPLRNHIELGHPYPTLTRRAQFLIDHPWYLEAGEDLPVHKEPPAMGGDHPFRLSGGHSRWSVHAMNMTNPLMLETHRGKPFVVINDAVARAKGIADDAPVRVWNDVGEFVAPALVSPRQRPDGLTVYNGFEGFLFPNGNGSNEVEVGMVKWLHLVGDYGHLSHSPIEWQPVPFDRCINVDCEPYKGAA